MSVTLKFSQKIISALIFNIFPSYLLHILLNVAVSFNLFYVFVCHGNFLKIQMIYDIKEVNKNGTIHRDITAFVVMIMIDHYVASGYQAYSTISLEHQSYVSRGNRYNFYLHSFHTIPNCKNSSIFMLSLS